MSQLTQANLTSHNNSKTTEGTAPEKQTMQRFRQEHDQYRHFLVTGDVQTQREQNAKSYNVTGGNSGDRPSTGNIGIVLTSLVDRKPKL